jgi:uncharacterized protein YneF (UPF0154 family)
MRKIFLYVLAFFLIPFYPILKRIQKRLGEKIQIGEKIVVVMKDGNGRKTFIN